MPKTPSCLSGLRKKGWREPKTQSPLITEPMKFLSLSLSKLDRRLSSRTFVGAADTIKCVRDRGLDHAVQREKNLRPLLNLKNLIKSEPSKSLPISIITQRKDSLEIPTRPIEFIRKYPTIFQEFLPGGIGIHPHVKLTPEVLNIDAEEQLVYQSESYKQDLADRLLKLLMISRINKIPLGVLDALKWDLGLPQDYLKSLVPEFPHYFRLVGAKETSYGSEGSGELDLVCWSNELAVSILEKKSVKGERGNLKGMPVAFPMKFSKSFEMDRKLKKWVDEWQKLPYVSPYENASYLPLKSDESDKWVAAILHEVLNLFVAKRAERNNVLYLGDHLGIRSRFKRVLLHHPGIFYLSGKSGTYTVVLRDAYKRGLLVESNPLMNVRNQYIHLMNKVMEDHKAITLPGRSKQEEEKGTIKEQEADDVSSEEENDEESDDLSGSDVEDASHDDHEVEGHKGVGRNVASSRGRANRRKNLDTKTYAGNTKGEKATRKHWDKTKDKVPLKSF